MTEFLCKRFIKDSANIKNPSVRSSYGKFAGIVGMICNVFLFAGKLTAGIISASVSVTADAFNNLSDASSSFISLLGFKLAEKPADKEHPYGHGRYEYLSGLTVAALILVIGVELFKSGIEKIIHPEKKVFSVVSIVILILSIAVKIWLAYFNKRIGEKINSEALRATSADSRNDVISTSCVLIASVISKLICFDLDGYVACLVALFILFSGIGIIKETIAPLLGKAPQPEFVEYIEQKILSYPKVLGIHDLMIHDYGPGRLLVSVHIEMPAELDIMDGHDIADNIERDFLQNDKIIMTIHYDPIVTDNPIMNELKTEILFVTNRFDDNIRIHDLRIVPGSDHTNVIFDCVIPFGADLDTSELKHEVELHIRDKFGNFYTVIRFENSFVG